METKLTLKLDKEIIQMAKKYASSHDTSLSKIVENYFKSLTAPPSPKIKKSKLVQELSGIIDLDINENYEENYGNYLENKYK
jgi:hypothetical protein